ncbi:Crp/Fnr family transcriptional regulator [Microvirga sp. G4-2]|uniref:Crp/Fnr family transcriptional regulator n=1 Tax=Microvirga sp. G4-2 TaxID=3434467 RepID=UPI004044FD5E
MAASVHLRAVGLVEDHPCDLPITQGEFADAMGITPVHVNRVIQQMRADGLIELKGDRLNIPDWGKLKEVGEFDPTYLHLETNQAAACPSLFSPYAWRQALTKKAH